MKKQLYITEPMLRGRLHIAYPMISFMQHPDGETFLYNYFINLECQRNNHDLNLCFVSQIDNESTSWIHYLNKHHYYKEFILETGLELHEALQSEINNGNYIYIALDDYYLPCKRENIHNTHINLICGYDTDKKEYLSVGYDKNQKYRLLPIPFQSITSAYNPYPFAEVFKTDYEKHFSFDVEHFRQQLIDFINEENNLVTSEALLEKGNIEKTKYVYGLAVFEKVYEHVINIESGCGLDFRNFYQLYELALLNCKRLKYLSGNYKRVPEKLFDLSNEIYKSAQLAKLLIIKYTYTKEHEQLLKVLKLLTSQKEKTKLLYNQLLDYSFLLY